MPTTRDFEVFRGKAKKLRTAAPMIGLQTKGLIVLNPSAHAILGAPEAVELLYDRDARAIGIRAGDGARAHTYALRTAKGGVSKMISGAAFMRHYGISVETLVHIPAELDGDILIGRLP